MLRDAEKTEMVKSSAESIWPPTRSATKVAVPRRGTSKIETPI
jgi:hypothetical protein